MALPVYVVRTRDLDGTDTFDAPHNNLEFSYVLNGPGVATFTMPLRETGVTRANFAPWKRECVILRDAVEVWGGYIISTPASSTSPAEVRVHAEGWFSKLQKRMVTTDKIYTNDEQLDIAWDLIAYTQAKTNGDMGITRWGGETPSGVNRDARFRYWERVVIGEALQELGDHNNGFDFEITPAKVWKAYSPRKGVATGLTFKMIDGDETNNAYGMSVDVDGSDTATDVHAMGAGDRDRTCISVVSDSAKSLEYGLLEEAIDFRDIKHFDSLTAKGTKYLNQHKGVRFQPQLSIVTDVPAWGSYSVGDTATVTADYGFLDFTGTFRIIAIVPHVTQAGSETITVHFDEVLAP